MPRRILWQILPRKGLLRWKLVRGGRFDQNFLFQKSAIKEAKRLQAFEWDAYHFPSELAIHGRDGKIREKDTFPRSSDPESSPG